MIAVPNDAVPRWAFCEFVRAQGFEVIERPGEIEIARDTFVRVWFVPEQDDHISNWLIERITEECDISQEDVDNFFAALADPNLGPN